MSQEGLHTITDSVRKIQLIIREDKFTVQQLEEIERILGQAANGVHTTLQYERSQSTKTEQ